MRTALLQLLVIKMSIAIKNIADESWSSILYGEKRCRNILSAKGSKALREYFRKRFTIPQQSLY